MANPRFRKISRAQTSTTCVWPSGTEIQCRPGARFAHPTFLGGRARPSVTLFVQRAQGTRQVARDGWGSELGCEVLGIA